MGMYLKLHNDAQAMSAMGQKQTFSAPPNCVCFWGESGRMTMNVCFGVESGTLFETAERVR